MATFGLRAKSLLLMGLVSLLVLLVATAVSWQVVGGVQAFFVEQYAQTTTALARERLVAPVSRQLALARRFASLTSTRDWLADETDPGKVSRFFTEARSYSQSFEDGLYFVGSASTLNYYLNDRSGPESSQARYRMRSGNPANDWFFTSMAARNTYNINVDTDPAVKGVKVWFNVVVTDSDDPAAARRLGVAGTGIDLTGLLQDYRDSLGSGITPMAINRNGAIQMHPDWSRVAMNSAAGGIEDRETNLLARLSPQDADALRAAMVRTTAIDKSIELLSVQMDGAPRLLAITYLEEIQWYVVNAFDPAAVRPARMQTLIVGAVVTALLLLTAVLGIGLAVSRMVLRPLHQLQRGVLAVGQGRYDMPLPENRRDEFGDLSRMFRFMAQEVQRTTQTLEQRVEERTRDLAEANRVMTVAQRQISDSLDYARLIQRGLLAKDVACTDAAVDIGWLWQPKDVVGGDFHFSRRIGDTLILGLFDCAGHGVPGALMTMRTHAALEQALADTPPGDPAAVLTRLDALLRDSPLVGPAGDSRFFATGVDAGLLMIDTARRRAVFSGARIDLYSRPPGEVTRADVIDCATGSRRCLGDGKPATFSTAEIPLIAGQCLYMVSDGILDQSGGPEGFGFGRHRLLDVVLTHGTDGAAAQIAALAAAVTDYQGPLPQRDDMTALCVRLK